MFYHASQVPNLQVLKPYLSEHGRPLVYASSMRENTLVYLSNAVEKHCRAVGFVHSGSYKKWGSYGFDNNGILVLDEYYPGATRDTYNGVSGYIYATPLHAAFTALNNIPFAYTAEVAVPVSHCEFIPDAYEALQKAATAGKLILRQFHENSPEKLSWIQASIQKEYETADPAYRCFLKAKFDF